MGCTQSKSAVIYSQDEVCQDLDTCSTFVPSLKSSMSTLETPRLCLESSDGSQTFLSVTCRDVHRRSGRQSTYSDSWSSTDSVAPGSSSCLEPFSTVASSPTPGLHGATNGCGTA